MADREDREDWKRERSLLALGQAMRGEDDPDASLVSIGDRADSSWRKDAAARHRLARSRREARTNPTPSAAVETERFRSEPEAAAPPFAQAEAAPAERPGRIGAFVARLRNAVSRKPSNEADDDISSEFAAFGEGTRPADASLPSGVANPDSVLMPWPGPRLAFQPGFDAAYSGPMGPPSRSPLMPPQPIYSAPPPYPHAQQAGYPQMQPWQVPSPACYPYAQAMAPYAGHMSYPSPPAPPRPSPYPDQSPVESTQVKESAEQAPIEEIRASLREFREAVRELTESRARRRYF